MQKNKRPTLLAMATMSLMLCLACKDDPNPRTMADSGASAQEQSEARSRIRAKVRKVLGRADLLRHNTEKWLRLHVGNNVVERDRIRTAKESETVLTVSDGSSLWISELSDVVIDAEIFDSLSHQVSVSVYHGSISFDVQKQPEGRYMEFKTGTAIASIRGTAGFVGNVNGQMVASLKEGLVEVKSNSGLSENIGANQTALVRRDGSIKTLNLKSSGTQTLVKTISEMGTKVETATPEAMEEALVEFDKGYAARSDSFSGKLSFRANPLADTLWLPSVTLQARVTPGVIVTVLGESDTVGENGIYQRTFEWADNAYGVKRFLASCGDGDVEIPCYVWSAVYAAPAVTKAEPVVEDSVSGNTVSESQAQNDPVAKKLDVSVKVAGGRTERKHLDLPANEYKTKLRFSLAGITEADVSEIANITVTRKGKTVKTFSGAELGGLLYEVPVEIALNKIANFDIKVALKNGNVVSAKKTYEVFCFRRNHMGKARNCVQYDRADGGGCDERHEEEYRYVKENGILEEE